MVNAAPLNRFFVYRRVYEILIKFGFKFPRIVK